MEMLPQRARSSAHGQRFSQHGADIAKAIDDNVPIVDTNIETETEKSIRNFVTRFLCCEVLIARMTQMRISEFDDALDRAKSI